MNCLLSIEAGTVCSINYSIVATVWHKDAGAVIVNYLVYCLLRDNDLCGGCSLWLFVDATLPSGSCQAGSHGPFYMVPLYIASLE